MFGYHAAVIRLKRYLPLLLLAALAVALIVLGVPARLAPAAMFDDATTLLGLASSRPLTVFALLCASIALTTAVGLPGAVVLFAIAGFLLGVPAAMAAAAVGNTIGTSALFFALRKAFFRPKPDALPDAGAMSRIRAGFARNPLAYALFLRAMPVLPNGAVTAALAAVRCRWPTFLLAGALGPQANAALMGWLGAQLAYEVRAGRGLNLDTLGDPRWWLPLALLALLMLVPAVLRRRRRTAAAVAAAAAHPTIDPAR